MNKKIGIISSLVSILSLVLFVVFLTLNESSSYHASLLTFVFSFIILLSTINGLSVNRSQTASLVAITFSSIALSIFSIVSFTQFTTIRIRSVVEGHSEMLEKVLSTQNGDSLFSLFLLLGFLILSLATFFCSFTINKQLVVGKVLFFLMFLQIIFAIVFLIVLLLMTQTTIVLIVWAIVMAITCFTAIFYFKNAKDIVFEK